MTTKKEMARLIEQMADTPEATQWLRERNEAMRKSLRDISLSAVQYDAAGGRSGHGDSTAEKVLKRAETGGADPHQRKSDSRQAASTF